MGGRRKIRRNLLLATDYSFEFYPVNDKHRLMQQPDHKINSGFTLIELSVVLAIIGVILYGSMSLLVVGVQTAQVNSTVATMDAIEKALLNYRVAYNRLPCPTDLTATATSANYGIEAANMGSCTGGSPAANFIAASGTAEGGVPVRSLRLPDSFMFDGWGHKFRYAVNPTYTVASVSSPTNAAAITVNDASGAARSTAAIYAIVSHGANGHGAYTSNGVVVNAGSTNVDEQTNCHCDNTAAHTGGAGILTPVTYVQKAPTIATAGSPLTTFDDIVTYKEGWQMMTPNLATNDFVPVAQYYRTVTIDHTKVGTVGNTDQSSFPVLFSGTYSYLATTAHGGNVNNTNGYDITFTSDAAGQNSLPFERESYNATTGAVNFWVQVPTVSHSANTVIYLQYGNSTITTDQSNKTKTWDSNFVGVWHLPESSGTTNTDSTSNGFNATKVSSTHPNSVTGKIAGGQQYNNSDAGGNPTDYDMVSDNATLDFGANQNFTVSAWVKSSQAAIASYWPMILTKEVYSPSQQGYNLVLFNGTYDTSWYFEIYVGGSAQQVYGTSSINDGNWHYVVGERTGSTLYSYQDGTSANNAASSSGSVSTTGYLNFGACSDPNPGSDCTVTNFIGTVDEIRVSNTARSADWIKTEYNNQSSPSTFYTVGAQTAH